MNKFFNRNSTKLIILCFLIFVIIGYNCYTPKKEYFVVKLGSNQPELLLDQNDFASVINGLKPKSVKGTFTTDDLSELVRELKGLYVATMTGQYKRNCRTNRQKTSSKCTRMNDMLSLIHETNNVQYAGNPVTSKEEWLNAIIDTGFRTFPAAKPRDYQRVDKNVIRAIKEKKPLVEVVATN